MRRKVSDRNELFNLLRLGKKVVKPILYDEIKASPQYRYYVKQKDKKRWEDTKKWLQTIGCEYKESKEFKRVQRLH